VNVGHDLVGAFAAGIIVNPRLARGQYHDGMIWRVSFALHEQAMVDPRSGRVMNANVADYHVPVNADLPWMEIGITGTARAIANAVWHETGVRVHRFPVATIVAFSG
jgi:xanthine dehydrogenase YagR molybdenum-binding subunit